MQSLWILNQVQNDIDYGQMTMDNGQKRLKFPGDYSGGGPPVTIPNTAVKPSRVEDTWALGPGKIDCRQDYI